MDMLVKLYDLPDARAAFERLRGHRIQIRRALAPERHKVVAWVRENLSQAWASETEVAFGRQPVSCFIAVKPDFNVRLDGAFHQWRRVPPR